MDYLRYTLFRSYNHIRERVAHEHRFLELGRTTSNIRALRKETVLNNHKKLIDLFKLDVLFVLVSTFAFILYSFDLIALKLAMYFIAPLFSLFTSSLFYFIFISRSENFVESSDSSELQVLENALSFRVGGPILTLIASVIGYCCVLQDNGSGGFGGVPGKIVADQWAEVLDSPKNRWNGGMDECFVSMVISGMVTSVILSLQGVMMVILLKAIKLDWGRLQGSEEQVGEEKFDLCCDGEGDLEWVRNQQ